MALSGHNYRLQYTVITLSVYCPARGTITLEPYNWFMKSEKHLGTMKSYAGCIGNQMVHQSNLGTLQKKCPNLEH